MKKILLLPIMLLIPAQITAVDFTGARFKNNSGKTLKAKIDYWTTEKEWNEVLDGKSVDLKSKKESGRYIHWKTKDDENTTYKTLKGYNSPDTITVTDGGKEYSIKHSTGTDTKTADVIIKKSVEQKEATRKQKLIIIKNISGKTVTVKPLGATGYSLENNKSIEKEPGSKKAFIHISWDNNKYFKTKKEYGQGTEIIVKKDKKCVDSSDKTIDLIEVEDEK